MHTCMHDGIKELMIHNDHHRGKELLTAGREKWKKMDVMATGHDAPVFALCNYRSALLPVADAHGR
eukprot:113551-Pelagomonas_calceolata.AAC.2